MDFIGIKTNKFAINCYNATSEAHLKDIMLKDGYFYLTGHYKGTVLFDSTIPQTGSTWNFYLWKRKNNL